MRDRRVGAVLVTEDDGRLVGIFTGRDAVHRVLAEGKSAGDTKLAEVMPRDPDAMPPGKTAIEVLRLMEDGRYRHMPIVDNDKVVGIGIAKQIVIATVAEDDAAFDEDGAARLLTSFRWHGFPASVHRLDLDPGPGGPAEALLGVAREQGALLVTGGYGHSRLSERFFGGFTQRILRGAEIPVLMRIDVAVLE